MKTAFNSASSPSRPNNAIVAPTFPSGFLRDKRGRVIKTEEDFATAEHRLADGRKARYRAGKTVYVEPAKPKEQELKKAALTSGEERRSHKVKKELGRKARDLQL